jgi:hypothetical protein
MKRPIAYKVPTLIENSKGDEAKDAMQEWREWIAYVNYLEAKLKFITC